MNESADVRTTGKTRRRMLVLGAIILGGMAILIAILPTVVSRTRLRDVLLSATLPPQISAKCEDAAIGWFQPLTAETITVADADNRWEIKASGATSERTLLQLVTSSSQLGEFVINQPVISINVDAWATTPRAVEKSEPLESKTKRDVAIAIRVQDAKIQTTTADVNAPNVIAERVSVAAEFTRRGKIETLTIEPGTPLHRANLSPEMCHTVLKYVAPIVSDAAWTEGSLSVRLDECTIPFNNPVNSIVAGELAIHSVRVGVREGVGQQITQLVGSLTQKDIPTTIKLANDSRVQFTVANGIVSHQGLAFGLPEVSDELVIKTHGTVGFDKRIDLKADLPLPFHLLGDGPIAQALGNETLYLPITGTLDNPTVRFDGKGQPVSELITKLANPLLTGQSSVGELLSGFRIWRQKRQEKHLNILPGDDGLSDESRTTDPPANEGRTDDDRNDDEDRADDDAVDADKSRPGILERLRDRRRRRLNARDSKSMN